jgi:antitoxin PrlF
MPAAKSKPTRDPQPSAGNEYRGKQTRTGNSFGFRFDRALFKSHPEFTGEVKAQVIAPGRMLVSVAEPAANRHDPVMESFLAFLASDIAEAPEAIKPMSPELAQRIDSLVEGVSVSGIDTGIDYPPATARESDFAHLLNNGSNCVVKCGEVFRPLPAALRWPRRVLCHE